MKKGSVVTFPAEKELASIQRAIRITPSELRLVESVGKRERRSFANIVRLCLANELARLERRPVPFRWR